ncbi:hypothetical protein ABIB48_000391 [Arthrobacter sp. UYCu511]|uniref:HNH endonuclease signature motif containing protein n=1 Tax=Arthrobacter sp. UYCu511 TaxID=3156337 RepID=UPI003392A422
MGNSREVPADRDASSTPLSAADLIDGLALPTLEPLSWFISSMQALPPLPIPGTNSAQPDEGPSEIAAPQSQLESVRALIDGCGEALSALRRHQNQCAALVALMVDRLESAAMLEGGLLTLDWWQKGCALDQISAELANILHVPESVAGVLIEKSMMLVRKLPTSMELLSAGELGWDFALIIAEETSLLHQAEIPQEAIDSFEKRLLEHAGNKTLPSFRSTARRLRERSYPETIVARTRRAYADRNVRVHRGFDGMSWFSLYGPAPTIEGIWDQCTYTAQAARGDHEVRTLSQLRADVAAALLLRQSMDENGIHLPASSQAGTTNAVPANPVVTNTESTRGHWGQMDGSASGGDSGASLDLLPWQLRPEPDACGEGLFPDPDRGGALLHPWQVPVFEDANYYDPLFHEPDPRNRPDWLCNSQLPELSIASTVSGEVWPPLPQVTPVLLVPALSLLGVTNEPAWMEGTGPISMEVAKRLAVEAGSFLRVLVDPLTNRPIDRYPDRYRIDRAMRTMLLIRDVYCQFPGCMAKAINCDVDHVKSFESGGRSIYNNLEHLCGHHHRVKHFKDDKDRHGRRRCIAEPERQSLRLRGWSPRVEENGTISWISPSGRYCPPEPPEQQPPVYPKWLKKIIQGSLGQHPSGGQIGQRILAGEPLAAAARQERSNDSWDGVVGDSESWDGVGLTEDCWGGDTLPDPPAATPYDEEDDAILTRLAILRAQDQQLLGLADAA